MAHIHKTMLINAPMDQVREFTRDPNHWDEWFVGLREADEIKGDGGPGTVVKHQFRMAGVTLPITSKVVDEKIGPNQITAMLSFEGAINGNQKYEYKASGDRTELTVDIEYTVPGKVLGRIADRLLVERLQDKALEHSLENLKLLTEANVPAVAAR